LTSHPQLLISKSTLPSLFTSLSLHDALPILNRLAGLIAKQRGQVPLRSTQCGGKDVEREWLGVALLDEGEHSRDQRRRELLSTPDRKSTRLNSSHRTISYAVFCLKKKKKTKE